MQLSEIFEYLMYGELANLAVSSNNEGEIKEKDMPKLISNINLALIDIHKRYPVFVKLVNIQLYEFISMYKLDKKYSVTTPDISVMYPYIMDSAFYPFKNDVIKVLKIHSEGCDEYPINVETDQLSLYTPSYNTIQVPYPLDDNIITVEYQAYPAKIPLTVTDPSTVSIDLPEFFLEPLISFVNYKLYGATGLEKPEAVNFMQKYELQMRQINDLGVFNIDTRENCKLECNQWV